MSTEEKKSQAEENIDAKKDKLETEVVEDTDKMIEVKESEFNALKKEAAEAKDKYVRIMAEFENARKRMDRDRQEFIKFANEGLIVEFLGVLDNLDRSVAAARDKHEDYNAFLKGVELVMAQVYEMIKKQGIEPVEALGKKFDPHCHEVLMQEENDEAEEDTVLEEFQKGYKLHGRVVRTAKVKLSKKVG